MSQTTKMHENNPGDSGMNAYLFVDTFAFEKLAAQPECRIRHRGARMTGYETYIIEQWACERKVNTVVASYTGNSQHVVEVQVLLVPKRLEEWSQVTFNHFEELVRMHILPKETQLGNMLVTSLSSLPSNLSLVSMPREFRKSYAYFVVNENLRRLNVVGRVAVSAEAPGDSMIATFRRVFMASPLVSAIYAVQEVVTLIQISLFYYGLLEPNMIDGLLCDHTLKAIEAWWCTFGRQRFRVALPRPQDKLYMRLTCSALVGTITGARQRLSALGLKPPKDPFDAENFVDCIRRFQKLMKISRTSRLDDQTYLKLIQETAKMSSFGNNGMLTAMKSTVKESLSGKASEAVDDWETLNLELLARNVRGGRAKYLWQGKGSESVPHLTSSLSISELGTKTSIPLISLEFHESDRHHHHHHHHHHSKRNGSNNQDTSTVNTESRRLSDTPPPPHNESDQEAESHALNNVEHQTESHTSLVNRFRKRKQVLGDAFDDKTSQSPSTVPSAYAHMRTQSTSSDQWFAKQSHQVNSLSWGVPSNDLNKSDRTVCEPEVSNADEHHIVESDAERYDGRCVDDIPINSLLTRDDMYDNNVVHDKSLTNLRRTASLSVIDENVFTFDSLSSLPRILNMYEQAQALQYQLHTQKDSDKVAQAEIQKQAKLNESTITEAQKDNLLIKYHANASLRKGEAVTRRMKELEAFMARLDYELATLSVKLKDVDQSVIAFAAKVETIDAKWLKMKNLQIKPWWSRWLPWSG